MAQPMPASSSDLRVTQRHEEDTQPSPALSEEISMKGTRRSQHLQELLKNQKLEEQEEKEQEQDEEEEEEEGDEKFHDPIVIDATSDKTRLTRPRPITLYHRSLFRFTLSCRSSPSSSAALNGGAPATSLRQLFKKERSGEGRDFQESADEFWWKKAMRMTILVFRSFSSSVRRCYKNSADCCAAGLNYEGFGNENSVSGKRNYFQRQHRRQEAAEREKIQGHFAASLDSVRAARPIDCSRDQCGWGQEYSSPGQFSWESTSTTTPTHYDYSNRQLIQRHQQQSAHSIISTITTTTEMLYYSSNLMTPYEIQHSLRRTFSVDDSEPRSK